MDEDGELLTEDELLLLEEQIRQPQNLNVASRQQLVQIPLLTSPDVDLILKHREKVGQFDSMDQILLIPGLSYFACQILPLVTTIREIIPMKISLRNRWVASNNDSRILLQTKIMMGSIKGGFTLERDPLEPTLSDFISGHMTASFADGSVKLILGDHQAVWGYGLLFGRTAKPMKSSENIRGLFRMGQGLKIYRSSLEYWALRGIGFESNNRFGQWILSLSSSPKDASIQNGQWMNFSTSGNHQTETSLDRKHNLQDQIALMGWKSGSENWDIGIAIAREQWVYTKTQLNNLPPKSYGSMFGQIRHGSLDLFGEMATYTRMSPAFVGGVSFTGEQIRWIAGYRHYPHGFQGPRSQPFREWSSEKLNEIGVFQGISLRSGRHRLYTYGDMYHQTTGNNLTGRPIQGFETATTWRYHLKPSTISIRWKLEEKSEEDAIFFTGEDGLTGPVKAEKESWRITTVMKLSRSFRIQLQGDRLSYTDPDTMYWGHALSIKVYLFHKSWRGIINWVGFVSDDYQSRVYVWDLNLPGELRSHSFSPTGQSLALLFRFSTSTGATFSARVRSTWKFSRFTGEWFQPDLEGAIQMDIAF